MKKFRLILCISVFSLLGPVLFAHGNGFFCSEVMLGTGITIYDDNSGSERKQLLDTSDYKRIVAGLSYNAVLGISEQIKLLFGADLMSDFLWEDDMYFHTLDYAFCTGVKIFPGAQGLNFGISYILGNRTDFVKVYKTVEKTGEGQTGEEKVLEETILTKSWGNGFKLFVQYDFMEDSSSKVKPLAGAYYRCVPRGGNLTDHTICLYGGIKL